MNLVDVAILLLVVAAAARGWRRGLVGQAFELGGGFIGLLAGLVFGPRIAGAVSSAPGLQGALISLVVVFLFLSIGQTLGFVVGHRFGRAARNAKLGRVDAGLGAAFGTGVTLIVFWLVGSLLVAAPSPALARAFGRSTILRAVNSTLPQPPDVLALVRQYLQTSGFPQVFAGLPPPLSEPVDLPSNRQARRAVEAAQESTLRISVPACGGMQLGSGWVAAPETVVTNAHVVAGGDPGSVRVQDRFGREVPATVVLFDAATDIAILRTQGLGAPELSLDTTSYDRGRAGATLGYPGAEQGRLVTHRAAVQARYTATGRDIYGRDRVDREVYELRAPVRQGDSGGPFVLPNGNVAGVVFAASTTDGGVGYALTGSEVEDEVELGARSTAPVDTGGCTH
ncbi:MAG TPA: MarP family serine protease [Actinomycetota bacterium]|nr:MarP family serine protease [Actinomycetota bacterium]